MIIGLILIALLSLPVWKIQKITVVNNGYYSKEEVINVSGLEGGNLLDLSFNKAKKGLLALPYIQEVNITYHFPGNVTIDLVENAPFMYVPFSGSYLCLNEQGQVIEQTSNLSVAIPVVDGLSFSEFKIGEMLGIQNDDAFLAVRDMINVLKEYEYVDKVKEIDIRIIAATNKNLEALVAEGKFREDLYYRLNVFPIDIPPLRERPKDIEDLTNFFIAKYSQLFNIPIRSLSNEVMSIFLSYSWPGNIRELKNITEYIINVIEERDLMITVKHLPPKLTNSLNIKEIKTLAEIEKEAIETLLLKYGHSSKDKIKVANTLDISLATLYRKLKLYNL